MAANSLNVAVKTVVWVVENKAYRPSVTADGDVPKVGEVFAVVGKRVVRLIPVSIEYRNDD